MLYRLCSFLIKSLVDKPESVKIDRIETETVDIFFVRVQKQDRGIILGKQGRTVTALRSFLEGVASRLDREVVVELID